MTDLDLERLGDLWRKEPDPEEIRELLRSANAARRRAQRALLFDYVYAAAMVIAVAIVVVLSPELDTLIAGGGAIFVLVMSQLRQRRFRRVELQGFTGDTATMLDQSIARAQALVKRSRISLIAMAPATLAGILFGLALDDRGGGGLFTGDAEEPWLKMLAIAIGVIVLPAMVAHLLLTIRRGQRELARLIEVREAYRRERESSESG